jgi:hypothetical protein
MSEYYAVVGDEVKGPLTMRDLNVLALRGEITAKSHVREIHALTWSDWETVSDGASVLALSVSPTITTRDSMRLVLSVLRKTSNYPILRMVCIVMIILDAIACVLFLITAMMQIETGSPGLYFILAAVAAGNVIAPLFGILLIDIADAVVKKVQ